ncbi:MAG: hypothetical protein EOO15_04930 [Chitinophagaceae bacterium]|nr:MAG: hypothetical protein EOO15_04930 [Chitinophagaceae bacterium]
MTPIQIKSNRLVYLIPIPICIGLMYAFYWALFESPDKAEGQGFLKVVAVFVFLAGTFLIYMSIRHLLKPPVLFEMNDDGILLNEGGVSSGLIKWEEIREVKETMVPTSRRGQLVPVLAVFLNDGVVRKQRYNALLQSVANLAGAVSGTPFYITPSILGKQYEAVKLELQKRAAVYPAVVSSDPGAAFDASEMARTYDEVSEHWAVRYLRGMYDVRTGKRKAGWALYSFFFLLIVAALHDFFLGRPLGVQLLFVVMGGFVVLFFYAAWQSRPRPAEK